jgi:2'-5' RNA ligase
VVDLARVGRADLDPELTRTRLWASVIATVPWPASADFVRPGLPAPHITVLGPIPATPETVARLDRVLDGDVEGSITATTSAFEVSVRGTGDFRPHSPVVYAAVDHGAEQLAAIAAALEERVCPRRERLWPYVAHLTLEHTDDDAILDRVAADYAGVRASWIVRSLLVSTGHGPANDLGSITWTPNRNHYLRKDHQ